MRTMRSTRLWLPGDDNCLNMAFYKDPAGGYDLFIRMVQKNGNVFSDSSKIGHGYLALGSTTVEMRNPNLLVPNRVNVKGIEDPRPFEQKGRRFLICNELVETEQGNLPRPSFYEVTGGVGQWVESAHGLLEDTACKSLIPITEELAVVRPCKSLLGYEYSIFLVKMNQGESLRFFDCEPIRVLIPRDPDFAVFGISAVAKIRAGILLFWHKVTSFEESKKQYLHFVSLLDRSGDEIARTDKPILTPENFPACPTPWVRGALYFTAMEIDESSDLCSTFVTVADVDNYFCQFSLSELLTRLA